MRLTEFIRSRAEGLLFALLFVVVAAGMTLACADAVADGGYTLTETDTGPVTAAAAPDSDTAADRDARPGGDWISQHLGALDTMQDLPLACADMHVSPPNAVRWLPAVVCVQRAQRVEWVRRWRSYDGPYVHPPGFMELHGLIVRHD